MAPSRVVPYHTANEREKLGELVASMRDRGWVGRPIVAHDLGDGRVQAWTAGHRLAAALEAPLEKVPVFVVDMTWHQNALYHLTHVWFGSTDENPVFALMEKDERPC